MDLENRTELPNSLEEHWMPFTSNKDFKENPRLMVGAQGVYYTDHHGNKLIDASSGLFCNPAGHSRPEIREAVSEQLEKLDYVQPFQQGYSGSFELARRISQHTPEDLNRIFFTIWQLDLRRRGSTDSHADFGLGLDLAQHPNCQGALSHTTDCAATG